MAAKKGENTRQLWKPKRGLHILKWISHIPARDAAQVGGVYKGSQNGEHCASHVSIYRLQEQCKAKYYKRRNGSVCEIQEGRFVTKVQIQQ
jgi:hypothetical protein